ncbi:MAG: hypothetical protein ACK5LC_10270 [Coprobacillaceae bacterium]
MYKDGVRYLFVKKPLEKEVGSNEEIAYQFSGFGNTYADNLTNYEIIDRPDKGLDFVSAKLPIFTNGEQIKYDILYHTNKKDEQVLYTNIEASNTFEFEAPKLDDGEYITAIIIDFGTVPYGFGNDNIIDMTFQVWEIPPEEVLVNTGILSYTLNDETYEIVTNKDEGGVSVDGWDSLLNNGNSIFEIIENYYIFLFALIVCFVVIIIIYRKSKKKNKE